MATKAHELGTEDGQVITVRQKKLFWEDRVSVWFSLIFLAVHLAYFGSVNYFGLVGIPTHAATWAVVPVLDMLYIVVQCFCLIVSGARSNEFGFVDIGVSSFTAIVLFGLTCFEAFSPAVHLSEYHWMVLICGLTAAMSETGNTMFGRMAFSRRSFGLSS